MKKLTVRYKPNEKDLKLVSDGEMEKYIFDIVKGANETYTVLLTSQELAIDYVRLAVKRGLIDHREVEFTYEDKVIFIDKLGFLDHWPIGFCDHMETIANELIEWTDDKKMENL